VTGIDWSGWAQLALGATFVFSLLRALYRVVTKIDMLEGHIHNLQNDNYHLESRVRGLERRMTP
jgi:hypothetical protein